MKKAFLLLLAVLFTSITFAQKKEKIKGSKIVTVTQKEVDNFESLEVEDNIEIFLSKGTTQSLEIEADDNLHETFKAELNGTTLRIYTDKEITSAKKISIRVTYTDNLKTITAKNEATINALADLQLENITIKNLDYSKSYLNVKSKNFTLVMNDKATAELNYQGDNVVVELSKNAQLKALIAASMTAKLDLYQKTTATIEGDAAEAKIRVDNNASFTGKKFTVKNLDLTAESYTHCNINAAENITIAASGKAEIELFGKPKVQVTNFADSAVLYKKEM
ncbi:GIN domain-containing protein [Flavobacterium suzhouense]|uniref:GIN domain-containing protein n=1 Tax=Flavobacterium suzhouense TaxID=1529638 RepID=A0ABW5NST7_9FLAO